MSASKLEKALASFITGFTLVAVMLMWLFGFALIIYQLYWYLKNGTWVTVSLYDWVTAEYAEGPREWVLMGREGRTGSVGRWFQSPDSWYGLHKVLEPLFKFIPVSLLVLLVAGKLHWELVKHFDQRRSKA